MQADDLKRVGTRLLATTALATFIAAAPVSVDLSADSGVIALRADVARAKDGDDNSGSGSDNSGSGSDNSGSGSDNSGSGSDNSGSGSDNSGSGSDNSGSGSDNSGSGSDDSGSGSDNSGSGSDNSGSGSDNSGSGSDDSGSGSDNSGSGSDNSGSGSDNSGSGGGDDDNSGPGGGDDDDHDEDEDEDEDEDRSGRRGGDDRADDRGPKVEIFGDTIEIVFADGTKEEIENGVYERKNAAGRTVEERLATQADFDRLLAATASGNLDTATRESSPGVAKTEVFGNNIEVTFADGTKEEIENGIFERKNAAGRTVEERPATQADFDRLAAIAGASVSGGGAAPGVPGGGTSVGEREFVLSDGTKIEVAGNNIEVKYGDGWKEEIEGGRYELKDPAGNTVIERPATAGDRSRLEAQIPG